MALKRANVAVESVSSKSEVPVFAVAGTQVTEFNKISAKIKDLEGEQKELRATIERDGLTKLFNYNLANSHNAVSSVKLEDEGDGGQVRISFQDSYKAADPDNASALFEALGADINDYAHETVKVGFSETAFLDDSGSFDEKIFKEFTDAINAVAKRLKKSSVLEVKKLVQPKINFHHDRWSDDKFATTDKQFKVQQALPAKVQVVPNVK